MRNEGMHLLEWVAYHRAIGFDRVVVATNDCDDGTDLMLDRLAGLDAVIHIRNPVPPGEKPQVMALRRALPHPAMAQVEWLLHCDADEFLNVTAGGGRVDDLLAAVGECDAISVLWRHFGSSGMTRWQKGSVIERLTLTERRPHYPMHKSLFRPDRFAAAALHMPKSPHSRDVVLKNAAGRILNPATLFDPGHNRHQDLVPGDLTWENAVINHYATCSEDIFLMKNHRGDGMALQTKKYYRNSRHWRRCNRNEVEDRSILRHLPALRERLAGYLADPLLAELDAAAFDWFVRRRDAILTEEQVRLWTHPRALPAPALQDQTEVPT